MRLNDSDFQHIIKNTPLISIDFIIRNEKDNILLAYRKNEPAKDYWFVPGGRIRKNECIKAAFNRISFSELNIVIDYKDTSFCGIYEQFYDKNAYKTRNVSTHYIVLLFSIKIPKTINLSDNDPQHSHFKWFQLEDLLKIKDVHKYTKQYFDNSFNYSK